MGSFPGAGFPSVHPVRKSPMVEQAVQTGPVDNMNSQKPPPVKVTPGVQRNGRQVPQGNAKTNGMYVLLQLRSAVSKRPSRGHSKPELLWFCPLLLY